MVGRVVRARRGSRPGARAVVAQKHRAGVAHPAQPVEGCSTQSSRCSGAISFAMSTASEIVRHDYLRLPPGMRRRYLSWAISRAACRGSAAVFPRAALSVGEYRCGEPVVLSLGVRMPRARPGSAVPSATMEYLARPGYHVYRHLAEHLALRLRDKGVKPGPTILSTLGLASSCSAGPQRPAPRRRGTFLSLPRPSPARMARLTRRPSPGWS